MPTKYFGQKLLNQLFNDNFLALIEVDQRKKIWRMFGEEPIGPIWSSNSEHFFVWGNIV